ncbi:MAG: arginine--tRNA ligase [Calditrichaeota bacterium]|nr:arginine--tRNA ligase [Calditrichota bacterium]RQW03773.1 MAG: arginine--tRNA ligase [Calditrichota bacterium]
MHLIESHLQKKIDDCLDELNYPHLSYAFEIPKIETHGDLSTNLAMLLAGPLGKPPRQIAQSLVDKLDLPDKQISRVEIAGPGFINFFFSAKFLHDTVRHILKLNRNFGKNAQGRDQKAQVEFVSANPTGPLTIGHGRQAVLGDTIANFLEWSGYEVIREYYFNNAGRQMRVLGDSVRLRYLELLREKIDFPEDYYQGEYITNIARGMIEKYSDALKGRLPEDLDLFIREAENEIFRDIKQTLKRLGISFDVYFNEKDLYEKGNIDDVIRRFKEKDLAYEKEGALWFRSTAFGLEQDRVILKSSGEPTYRLPDIAYHITKFERGFNLIVDIFGADHIATYPDVLAGVKALGYDESRIKVLIHQFVTLYQGSEKVKMSTRKANFVTLDELMDEVGVDVTRWFFLMRNMDSHLNFDLVLAKTQSDENPVYYNQYAHARICSILRNAEEKGISFTDMNSLNRLENPNEFQLIKKMVEFPAVIERSTREFTPHQLTQYLSELSTVFHKFYTECWVLSTDKELSQARLALCLATKTVLANGFAILGVSAPESM